MGRVEAFFVPDGDAFVSTDWTRGPWGPEAQHAGPAAGLLGRAIEALVPDGGFVVARFTMEVLRAIPVVPVRVEAGMVRPGRRVQMAEARLRDAADGSEVAVARAWLIATSDHGIPERNLEATAWPSPAEAEPLPTWDPGYTPSYFDAMEWRTAGGTFLGLGPAAAWMRMRVPLVAGEPIAPLSRVLVAADSGNGISMELPLPDFLFVNTELTVHLARLPAGEWVCLDAVSRIGPDGVGVAQSVLWDERSRIGAGAQALLVAPR
jgi:hypothetical protein